MAEPVTIFEMGPRDGLQNEPIQVPTEDKISLVNSLSECGFKKIEVTSFVSSKWVPQMSDAAEVLAGITRKQNVAYSALTPNMRGYENAVTAKADEIAVFASASEGFSQKNINCSIAESVERFKPILEEAANISLPVRGYVSCVTDCPYDGPTPAGVVADLADLLIRMGCYEVSLGDTIGAGTPETIGRMLEAVSSAVPSTKLAGHYHDTKSRAIENIDVSLSYGLRTFDAAIGGLGGCPYAEGASGNVATEEVVRFLESKGYETGIDFDKLSEVAESVWQWKKRP